MNKNIKKYFTNIFDNKTYLSKLFFLLFYNDFIEGEYHFIFNDPLYSNIDYCEMEKLILSCLEDNKNNNNLNNFFLNILLIGLDEKYKSIVKEYK